jgi:hypothetical protein
VAPAALRKSGTTLKLGEAATIQVNNAGNKWIGSLKVTALEKAPASDLKDLGVRADAGSVYYLRYDVTYVSGTTKFPPAGDNISWTRLHPLGAAGQSLSKVNNPDFKKCSPIAYKKDGHMDFDKAKLTLGDTTTNMCSAFLIDKDTVTQVVHTFLDTAEKADQTTDKA